MSASDSLEALVAAVEALDDPEAKARSRALVSGVLELHREGLEAALALIGRRADGDAIVGELAAEPAVSTLLMLHDLHPRSALERARDALAALEPRLRGLGGRVQDVAETPTGLRVRLTRDDPSRHGAALRELIEAALTEVAPDAALLLEGAEDAPALVPPSKLTEKRR